MLMSRFINITYHERIFVDGTLLRELPKQIGMNHEEERSESCLQLIGAQRTTHLDVKALRQVKCLVVVQTESKQDNL